MGFLTVFNSLISILELGYWKKIDIFSFGIHYSSFIIRILAVYVLCDIFEIAILLLLFIFCALLDDVIERQALSLRRWLT